MKKTKKSNKKKIIDIKSILFNKDLDGFKNIGTARLANKKMENFLLINLIGNILEKGNIDLETFTKKLWKRIFENKLDIEDPSLMKLFPACDAMGPELSCEAFYWKMDYQKNEILFEALKEWRLKKSKEIKKPAYTICTNETINSIIEQKPKTLSKLKDIKGLGPTRIKEYGKDIIRISKSKPNKKQKRQSNDGKKIFLCRHRYCGNPQVIPIEKNAYKKFNIYEWLQHYGISYRDKAKPSKYDFPVKLSGYFNRLKELKEILNCRECDSQMVPNWKFAKTFAVEYQIESQDKKYKNKSAAYRVTVFHCQNNDCGEHKINYYISHCIECGKIIDSRDELNKCEEGLIICYDCYGCCALHQKEEREKDLVQFHCPKCSYRTIRIFEKKSNRWAFCVNSKCDYRKGTRTLYRRFRSASFKHVFYVNENKAQKTVTF
jgi:hypothetical protein|tara:strand:- start:190 stop:1491 length:1302 start_codon:yes stop_codon:yes gene_type:complete